MSSAAPSLGSQSFTLACFLVHSSGLSLPYSSQHTWGRASNILFLFFSLVCSQEKPFEVKNCPGVIQPLSATSPLLSGVNHCLKVLVDPLKIQATLTLLSLKQSLLFIHGHLVVGLAGSNTSQICRIIVSLQINLSCNIHMLIICMCVYLWQAL